MGHHTRVVASLFDLRVKLRNDIAELNIRSCRTSAFPSRFMAIVCSTERRCEI